MYTCTVYLHPQELNESQTKRVHVCERIHEAEIQTEPAETEPQSSETVAAIFINSSVNLSVLSIQ